jgi:hypothetical protein
MTEQMAHDHADGRFALERASRAELSFHGQPLVAF